MAVMAQQSRSAGTRYPQKSNSSAGGNATSLNRTQTPNRADTANQAAPPKQAAPTNRTPTPPNASNADRSASERRPYRPSGQPAGTRGSRPAQGYPSKAGAAAAGGQNKPDAEILFQKYFKSVGPRTYAAQIKRAGNGNHFVVLTEAKRDDKTDEVRKTRLFLFSEDFVAFFRMLHETAQFIRQNPVPDDVRKKRERFWTRKSTGARRSPSSGTSQGSARGS
jgi:hypothetical protein